MKIAAQTVTSALGVCIREQAKRFNPALESAPIAILWTDEKREWEAVLPKIKEALPELYSLGDYAPDDRTGPGVWLRMVADGQAGKVNSGETVILYLPGVGNGQLRTDLRGFKDDPQLAPLAELQYRGSFWLIPGYERGFYDPGHYRQCWDHLLFPAYPPQRLADAYSTGIAIGGSRREFDRPLPLRYRH